MKYEEYVAYEPILARRVAAASLDYILFFAIVFAYIWLVGAPNETGQIEAKGFRHLFVIFLIWFIYFPVMESMFGYTAFKGLFDLRVVQERRKDFPLWVTFKRHILDFVDFFMFGLVAILLVKMTEEHKRLGDRFAHTHVVHEK